jgi:hypothetical protein
MIPSNRPIERTVKPDVAPVAGGEFSFRPNKGGGWLIKHLRFVFTASAAVATRTTAFEVNDGTNIYMTTAAQATIAAAGSRVFCAWSGDPVAPANVAYIPIGWPTDGLWLPQGHTLRSVTFNLDVGDLYTEVVARVVEYPSGSQRELWPIGPGVTVPPELA